MSFSNFGMKAYTELRSAYYGEHVFTLLCENYSVESCKVNFTVRNPFDRISKSPVMPIQSATINYTIKCGIPELSDKSIVCEGSFTTSIDKALQLMQNYQSLPEWTVSTAVYEKIEDEAEKIGIAGHKFANMDKMSKEYGSLIRQILGCATKEDLESLEPFQEGSYEQSGVQRCKTV